MASATRLVVCGLEFVGAMNDPEHVVVGLASLAQ
jgi:hypothetical protein